MRSTGTLLLIVSLLLTGSDARSRSSDCISHAERCVSRPVRSCLEEVQTCLGDESCNRQMVPVVQQCGSTDCDPEDCREATRQFYSTLPRGVASALAFCDCDGEEQECLQMKASIHSGSCLEESSEMQWTCLEALETCAEDTSCRKSFNRFLSKCFDAEESELYFSSDWLYLLDTDFFLGEDLECRKAFVETMGSVLHQPCACDAPHHHHPHPHQDKCTELKQIFQDKSLFKLQRTRGSPQGTQSHEPNSGQRTNNEASDEADSDPKRIPVEITSHEPNDDSSVVQRTASGAQEKWMSDVLIPDQLLYLLLYISALMMVALLVVGLVLHKLRRIHRAAAKPTFDAREPKSLMLPSLIL